MATGIAVSRILKAFEARRKCFHLFQHPVTIDTPRVESIRTPTAIARTKVKNFPNAIPLGPVASRDAMESAL